MPRLNQVHLNGLRAVEAVLRLGTLQKAAHELGVSPSAVSQHLGRAEAQLGRALFERGSTGLKPTSFGLAIGSRLSAGFREIEAALSLADRPKDALVVSVAPAFASKWLLPRLANHFRLYPDVILRIDASLDLADLDHSDVDVAIRLGDRLWPDVRAELLHPVEIFPVCAPPLAERLRAPSDLAGSLEIVDERSWFRWEDWFAAAGAEPVPLIRGARYSDPMLCIDAAIAGHGVMLAWEIVAADPLADGRLVEPFGIRAPTPFGHWIVTSASRRERREVTNFKTWLRDEIARMPRRAA
jgi:DNA-binding transcriptional LysR family regulator